MTQKINELRMRLTFLGAEGRALEEILVDNEVINISTLFIDYPNLVKSILTDGELFILTCVCGNAPCTDIDSEGIEEPIVVSHLGSVVTWEITDPKPHRFFHFGFEQYFSTILQFLRSLYVLQTEFGGDFNIGPDGFDQSQLSDCLRYLESLLDKDGSLMKPRLTLVR